MMRCPRFILLSAFVTLGWFHLGCSTDNSQTDPGNKQQPPTGPATAQSGSPAPGGTATTPQTSNDSAVVIADSIGAGLFTRYNYGQTVSKADTDTISTIILANITNPSSVFKALQSSNLADANFSGYDGTGGTSQPDFRSLLARLGGASSIFDSSVIGSVTADTPNHLKVIADKMKAAGKTQDTVKKVIFALGNNDFCAALGQQTVTQFEQQLQASYLTQARAVAAAFPQADLYFVSPINQTQLPGLTQSGFIHLGDQVPLFGNTLSCSTLQNIYCSSLTEANAAAHMTSLQRAVLNAVGSLAAELAGKGSRAVYYSDISQISFTTDYIAVDCYHPNVKGQIKLAEEAFSRAKKVTGSSSGTSLLLVGDFEDDR